MPTPILYSFSGLPGAGKTTLAQRLSAELQACYVRIDTIEQSIKEFSEFEVQGEGYQLSYRIASDNLKLGVSVVADSCNPVELTRREWMQIALKEGAKYINIEVSCSDQAEHQQRIESRVSTVPGLQLPNWNDVVSREYEPWVEPRLVIDTANSTMDKSFRDLLQKINAFHAKIISE